MSSQVSDEHAPAANEVREDPDGVALGYAGHAVTITRAAKRPASTGRSVAVAGLPGTAPGTETPPDPKGAPRPLEPGGRSFHVLRGREDVIGTVPAEGHFGRHHLRR